MKTLLVILALCVSAAAQTPQLTILTDEQNRFRPLAMDAITHQTEPFELTSPHNLSEDKRTRLSLFAQGVTEATIVMMRDASGSEQSAVIEDRHVLSGVAATQLTVLAPQNLVGPLAVWLVDGPTRSNEAIIAFRSSTGLTPAVPVSLIFAGNSLTAGYDTQKPLPTEQTYPYKLCEELKRQGYNAQCFNKGIGSQTTTEMLARTADIDSLITPTSIVIVWELGNDLMFTSSTEEQLFEHLASYAAGRRQRGAKVIVCTVPYRIDIALQPAKESIRQRLNERLRREYKDFADLMVDLDGDDRLLGLMQSDRVHYLPTGYSIIAEDVIPAAVSLIRGYAAS